VQRYVRMREVLVVGALSLLVAGSSAASTAPTSSITLLFAGDLMFHKGVKRTAQFHRRGGAGGSTTNDDGFAVPIDRLRTVTARADCSFCNLECPLVDAPAGDPYCMKTAGPFWFKAPAVAAHAVRRAGFSVASLANNHIDNAGTAGIASSAAILRRAGIAPVGAGATWDEAHRPAVVDVRGCKVAFVAYCSTHLGRDPNVDDPEQPHVCRSDPFGDEHEQLWRDLAAARAAASFVVLSFHWGPREYAYRPDPRLPAFARLCCERGADVVVGHHPHVLHAIERYDRRDGRPALICYSLGNLVSNQAPSYRASDERHDEDEARRREGALVLVTVAAPAVRITNVAVVPLWTDNNWHDFSAGREPARIQVVPIDDELARLEARMAFLRERRRRVGQALEGTLPEPKSLARAATRAAPSATPSDDTTPRPGPP